jgi:hypothetical protein
VGGLRGLHLQEGVVGEQRGLRREEEAAVVRQELHRQEEGEEEESQLGLQEVVAGEGECQWEQREKKLHQPQGGKRPRREGEEGEQ